MRPSVEWYLILKLKRIKVTLDRGKTHANDSCGGGMPSAAPIPESTRLHNQAHRSRRQLALPTVSVVRAAHAVKCTCHSANLVLHLHLHSPHISTRCETHCPGHRSLPAWFRRGKQRFCDDRRNHGADINLCMSDYRDG